MTANPRAVHAQSIIARQTAAEAAAKAAAAGDRAHAALKAHNGDLARYAGLDDEIAAAKKLQARATIEAGETAIAAPVLSDQIQGWITARNAAREKLETVQSVESDMAAEHEAARNAEAQAVEAVKATAMAVLVDDLEKTADIVQKLENEAAFWRGHANGVMQTIDVMTIPDERPMLSPRVIAALTLAPPNAAPADELMKSLVPPATVQFQSPRLSGEVPPTHADMDAVHQAHIRHEIAQNRASTMPWRVYLSQLQSDPQVCPPWFARDDWSLIGAAEELKQLEAGIAAGENDSDDAPLSARAVNLTTEAIWHTATSRPAQLAKATLLEWSMRTFLSDTLRNVEVEDGYSELLLGWTLVNDLLGLPTVPNIPLTREAVAAE